MEDHGFRREEKVSELNYYLCSLCLGERGEEGGLYCQASPSIVGWLIEKGKWGHCLPAKRFILCWLSLVPGAWTH